MINAIDINFIQRFFLIVIFGLALLLGVSVLLANFRIKTNRSFFWMVCSFCLLLLTAHLVYYPGLGVYANILGRLNFAFVAITLVSILFFVFNYPESTSKYPVLGLFTVILGCIIAILSVFTPFLVSSTNIVNSSVKLQLGNFQYVLFVYTIMVVIIALYYLIKAYIIADRVTKLRILFPLIGAGLVALFNIIFNIIVPSIYPNFSQFWIGDYSIIFFLTFSAYAIVKHQLFDIKVIATETTVILLSIGLFIETFLSNSFTEGLLKGIVWVLATYGGWVLIKSVKMEIKQKEDLQVLSKKLDEANRHLEDLDEEKDNFISMASHELNTPIAAIEGYLSMIIDEKMAGEINPKAMGYLENVYFSSKRLAALVRDLLNVSRIESHRIHIVNEEAQVEDVIEKAIAEVKIKADEVGHQLTFEKPTTPLPKTWFDISRVTEVIINIVGNAIKYTEPPGKIVVKAHADDGKIVIAIDDNGRGIPKDKEDHVFQKFSQVEVLKDQVKGTGLGMFISKNLIELHGGQIWFNSSVDTKDHGTTFYFSLPIHKTKPLDPHEGEGSLFQTSKPTGSTNSTDSKTPPVSTTPATSTTPAPTEKTPVPEPNVDNTKSQPQQKTEKPIEKKLSDISDRSSN